MATREPKPPEEPSLAESLPLFPELEMKPLGREAGQRGEEAEKEAVRVAGSSAEPDVEDAAAAVGPRFLAGLADVVVQAAVVALMLAGAWRAGVEPSLGQWPPMLLFLLAFSFLYTVVPLAFWGQTPGMASLHLVARSEEGESLTFGQCFVRWLAGWLTAALAGLPLLAAHGGRSLTDLVSRSGTFRSG